MVQQFPTQLMRINVVSHLHAKGGELFFDGHTTSSTNLKLDLSVESGVLAAASDKSGSGCCN